jgi:hypothetical protein
MGIKNTSVVISIEDKLKIEKYIEDFNKKTGFKISVAEFVKSSIREKLKQEVYVKWA